MVLLCLYIIGGLLFLVINLKDIEPEIRSQAQQSGITGYELSLGVFFTKLMFITFWPIILAIQAITILIAIIS